MLKTLKRGIVVAALTLFIVMGTVEAASSPLLLTFNIDHQTMCRGELRDFPISLGNTTDEPMLVHVDATAQSNQPERDGSGLVSFDKTDFVMAPQAGTIVHALLSVPTHERPGEYATLLRFTNQTPPLSAAVGVWLRFDVEPWRVGHKRCGRAP